MAGSREETSPRTETKKYLTKLKESEARYKNLISQSLDGILMTDFKSTLTLVNPSFCSMVGYSKEELLGTVFSRYIHPDERATTIEDHMRQMAGEIDTHPQTKRLLRKDGKTVFVEILGGPVKESGKIVGVQEIIRDTTGRRRLEQELETIIDLVPDALMITDFKGRIYQINKSVEEFSRFTREELLNMDSVINMYYYPEERAKALALLKEHGEFHNFEFTARIKGILMPGGIVQIIELIKDVDQKQDPEWDVMSF